MYLSLLALTALAVAQPLMDLLGRNPDFFLARAAPTFDVILLAILLGLAIPCLVPGIVLATHILHRNTGRSLHAVGMAFLGSLFILTILTHTPLGELPGWWVISLAAVLGLCLTWAHLRFSLVQSVFRFLAVSPLAVVAIFLLITPTSQIVLAADTKGEGLTAAVGNPVPVVMVTFDEFPIASIIDPKGNIQSEHFPAFARLATDGTWFRNAIGVHQRTREAIPTITTGIKAPLKGRIPTANDYPQTIFNLLNSAYDVYALESVTALCPETICDNRSREIAAFAPRWRALVSDLKVISGHVFLPEDLADWLPPIDQNWGDFGAVDPAETEDFDLRERFRNQINADRRTHVNRFLEFLQEPLEPGGFYFTHILFPHAYWTHLPDGRPYAVPGAVPGQQDEGWGDQAWLVEQAYQRHLLQVQYADKVIGDVIELLEAHGSYDEALIVVLADHGVAFRPGIAVRRGISQETIGDLAAIPLFIKQPHQQEGVIDDYRAETVDVVPTIADVLDVDIPWDIDGVSLLSNDRPKRTESTMLAPQGSVTFGIEGNEKFEVARYHRAFFGDRGPFGIAPRGYAALLGRELRSMNVGDSAFRVVLDHPDWYQHIDPQEDFVPSLLTGNVLADLDEGAVLAVALNGRIEAVTQTWIEGKETHFQALLPPESLRQGANSVEVLMVQSNGDVLHLLRLSAQQ